MQAEILSDNELADLTSYKHRAHQRKWLKDRNWVFIVSCGGRPPGGSDVRAHEAGHGQRHNRRSKPATDASGLDA